MKVSTANAFSHYGRPGKVVVEDRPMPTLLEPTDAVIKLAASCICGSDLWPYVARSL